MDPLTPVDIAGLGPRKMHADTDEPLPEPEDSVPICTPDRSRHRDDPADGV